MPLPRWQKAQRRSGLAVTLAVRERENGINSPHRQYDAYFFDPCIDFVALRYHVTA